MKNTCALFDLSGKVAVVTGASRGLGKAMALGLAQAGADVVVTDVLPMDETVAEIQKLGRKSVGIKMDVTNAKDIASMVAETVKKFKKIDILINNAGIYYPTPFEKMDEKSWMKIIEVNFKGAMACAQAVGTQMIKQKSGNIVSVASVAGIMAFAQSSAYNCSKAAIIMLTKTLAAEWAQYGIRVNAICPGIFATDMTKGLLEDKGMKNMINTRVPLKRYGTPDELAGTAIYLASDASSYVTGHALVVDGGWTVSL
ncbi:glucose 1-dehydrogenase [Candidatus Peregrinibacteria bacterium]|nr:glucose 1-dehydrogenase [Candidatus Peregrinibacteria bacterium]